jgi:hypothetical protein
VIAGWWQSNYVRLNQIMVRLSTFGRYVHFAFEIDARRDDWPNLAGIKLMRRARQGDWPNLAGTTATCFPVPFHALSFTHKHSDLNTSCISSLTPVHSNVWLKIKFYILMGWYMMPQVAKGKL